MKRTIISKLGTSLSAITAEIIGFYKSLAICFRKIDSNFQFLSSVMFFFCGSGAIAVWEWQIDSVSPSLHLHDNLMARLLFVLVRKTCMLPY